MSIRIDEYLGSKWGAYEEERKKIDLERTRQTRFRIYFEPSLTSKLLFVLNKKAPMVDDPATCPIN